MKQHSRLLKIKGEMYVTMHIPVEFTVEDTDGEYNPESEWADKDGWVSDPEPYGVDDILSQSANKYVKHDIELFKRLGWEMDEILCEDREQNYI